MPCPKHPHPWVPYDAFLICECETICSFCSEDLSAPSSLVKHVYQKHRNRKNMSYKIFDSLFQVYLVPEKDVQKRLYVFHSTPNVLEPGPSHKHITAYDLLANAINRIFEKVLSKMLIPIFMVQASRRILLSRKDWTPQRAFPRRTQQTQHLVGSWWQPQIKCGFRKPRTVARRITQVTSVRLLKE
ncbi:Zinc finger C2H2-type protein [Macrophomina phaseolina MS6]|uniref:Zinc finger C2H2-type protein n=1 Tax=Macrophomina phaseolina (strain MS6) TaxID=1126212 RepID=K2RI04_MACPH|nr:Zinc finger C2H2-type protein [Macrophomina phaseolina MS6]